jgi:hypothetical protein
LDRHTVRNWHAIRICYTVYLLNRVDIRLTVRHVHAFQHCYSQQSTLLH